MAGAITCKKSKRGWPRRSHRPIEHIKDRVGIECRPAHVETRRQSGHWEVDLLHPRKSRAAIPVAQERTTRYLLLAKQPGKHAQPILERIKLWFAPLPAQLRRSLTQDNGPEFFLHHQLNPLGVKTYFCQPHSPWQKCGIENTDGRIRRCIPRGTDPKASPMPTCNLSPTASTIPHANASASNPRRTLR